MFNKISEINENVENFEKFYNKKMSPFWEDFNFPKKEFFENKKDDSNNNLNKKILIISGPSRNGNHLLHSLMDSHPNLPRIPGEDSLINSLFPEMLKKPEETIKKIKSKECVDFLLSFSGFDFNKWDKHYNNLIKLQKNKNKTEIWSGMHYGKGENNFVFDYQDTIVPINYPALVEELNKKKDEIVNTSSFLEVIFIYINALKNLDPENKKRSKVNGKDNYYYNGLTFGSGIRGELNWLMERSDNVFALVPVRSFETYYFSFAKGFYNTEEIKEDILKEAWEHWFHKVTDYIILKRKFPDRIGLITFESMVLDTEESMKELSLFLDIPFDEIILKPTTLGFVTKGNSSKSKEEENRGRVYKAPIAKKLDSKYFPKGYLELWNVVKKLAI